MDEGALRRRHEANPDNPELLLQLARVIAEKELTDEARQLYRQAIISRLAALYQRQGDMEMSASVLYSVCDDERATSLEREKRFISTA